LTDEQIVEMEARPATTPATELLTQVGIVVVAHARADLAARCIQTLPSPVPCDRVVVVINDPAEVDPGEVEAVRERAVVVSPARRQGFGANLNLGVSRLPEEVEHLLLVNDDVEFLDGSVLKLLETLRDDARVGVVGPSLRQVHGKQPPLQPQFPTALRAALNMTVLPLGPAWAPLSRRAGVIAPDDPGELARKGWVIGAAMAVRMRAFREVGGFDEDFFLYYEETDFCYRVREAGWRIEWRSDAPVLHVHGSSTGDADLEDLFFQSERLYFRKRLGLLRAALLQAGLIALFTLSCAYNAACSVVRPGTRGRRLSLLRERWRLRLFWRGGSPAPR
jgi:N-acetylglucosaminyl-diphospho-decaprenol L-rhamnosyltransferase